MNITQVDIKKILSMYEGEDIPYVLSDLVLKMMNARKNASTIPSKANTKNKVKVYKK